MFIFSSTKEDMLGEIAKLEGAFICPEGAAAFGAAKLLKEQGWIKEHDILSFSLSLFSLYLFKILFIFLFIHILFLCFISFDI